MSRRTCRRPRPAERPPFWDERTRYDYNRYNSSAPLKRSPRRPRPPGDPPVPTATTKISCGKGGAASVVVGALVPADDDNERSAPEDTTDDGGKQGRKNSKRYEAAGYVSRSSVSAAGDPLKHSGRWVPAEYAISKQLQWTGYWTCCGNKTAFTTHCLDFDARIRQREAEHQHISAEKLNCARRPVAEKFRADWEKTGNAVLPSYPLGGLDYGGSRRSTSSEGGHQPTRERPFVRQKWLERLSHQAAKNIESDHGGASSAALSPSTTTSTPASVRAPAFAAGQEDAYTLLSALTRVGREHVRSVVQLALSEARVNAFVVISSLEGLLSVATEQLGREGSVGRSRRDVSQAGGRNEGGDKTNRTGEASQDSNAKRGTKLYPDLARDDNVSGDGSRRSAQSCNPTTPSSTNGSSAGRGESGAALCVRLGAVPAVLGCLEEHAGHKKIEPLAVRLLWVFASEVAAAEAIRGNPAVAAACAARMSPSAALPAACGFGDNGGTANTSKASVLSTGQASDGGEVGDGRGYDGREGSADSRKTAGDAASTTEASAKMFDSNGTSTVKAPDLRGPKTGSAAGDGHGPSFAVPAPSTMAKVPPCLSSNTRLEEEEEREEGTMSSAALTPRSLPRPQMKVPTTDLVFVLSVAVQDSPECQHLVLKAGGVAAMSVTLQHLVSRVKNETGSGWGGSAENCSDEYARLAETCLRVMEYLGRVERGRRRLVRGGSVEIAISTIRCFRCHSGVLTAATGLLLLLSVSPDGRGRILKARGFRVVFKAMQRLVGNDLVQVKGAEMLQKLINEESQARREMDSIKGGWQWLCQGTSEGDALIRYAPGEKHIPGWTVSEEEHLTTEKALATAEVAASNWTPYNLATFMGTMRSQHQLQIGNLAYYHFFRVVSEAGLLPHPHEDIHDWRQRLRRYEDERYIRVGNITRRRLARDKTGAHARSLASSSSL